ncbi:MAG: very short patch repair endonuclease [Opitutaceae bacterium]
MADVFTVSERSRVMSLIRSRGNRSTELRLIEIMRAAGMTGWRRGSRLPGRPDFVFRRERAAVFVDGCFWHGCPKCSQRVRTNGRFWREKIARNRQRDVSVSRCLRSLGWSVVRIREHEIRKKAAELPLRLLRVLSARRRSLDGGIGHQSL